MVFLQYFQCFSKLVFHDSVKPVFENVFLIFEYTVLIYLAQTDLP